MKRSSSKARLIILCGLPGSGKTTFGRKLEAKLGAVRFEPDEWMDALGINLYDEESREKIEQMQWKLGCRLLSLGLTIIVEWGTWGRAERDALRLGARALGAEVELHYLQVSADALLQRLRRRNRESPPIEPDALARWFDVFQPPTPEELALFDEPLLKASAAN